MVDWKERSVGKSYHKEPQAEIKEGLRRVHVANNLVSHWTDQRHVCLCQLCYDEALLELFFIVCHGWKQTNLPKTDSCQGEDILSHAVQSCEHKHEVERLAPPISRVICIARYGPRDLCHDGSGHLG